MNEQKFIEEMLLNMNEMSEQAEISLYGSTETAVVGFM